MNYGLLLLSHVICADRQIHNTEIELLDRFIEKHQPCPATLKAMESIFSQDEGHPSLEKCAEALLDSQDRRKLREFWLEIMEIAYTDGYLAPTEKEVIDKIARLWQLSQAEINEGIQAAEKFYRESRDKALSGEHYSSSSTVSFGAKLVSLAEKAFSREAVRNIAEVAPFGEIISRLQKEVLLAGPEYDQAIQHCAHIALEDYQFIYSKLSYVNQVLENLQLSIEQQANRLEEFLKSRRSGSSKEVMKQINATKEALDFKILKQLAEVRASLDAKSRALSHFSVAFMGKTKAGKSTLHAIITNEGWNAIGVGKQRTTRYNRIYEWKNIRIIDTPGIGAPGGQTDEEIAKSIIDESDVICYVVTNDSVQESEFQFLGLLEKHAKPLIVLMNIKNNLRDPRRLEIFLKQPEKLFARQGNNSLEGHFNRIREYVKNHYRNNSFEIVPVMLLAAQMSKEEKYHEIKEQLFKESRLQNFLDIIRESIIVNGVVRRSQTFLGSTVGNIEEPLRQINDEIHAYKHILKILQEKKERVYRDINFQKANSEQQLKVEISYIFQDIRSKIYPFALQNYKRDEKELTQGWNIIYNSSELSDKLEAAYRKTSEAYNNSISEILEEVGKEMQLIVRLNKSNSFGAISSDYDGFSLKIASRILAIAGTVMTIVFPITGFFLGIFGSVLGWFSGLFKSEDQKRGGAISKICQSIEEQVDKQEKEIKHQAISSFHEQSRKVSDAVESYFSGLIQGIELIQESMEVTTRELEAIKQDVNLAYSARIINYCCGESKNSTEIEIDNPRKFIQSVARDFGSQIIIRLSPNFPVPSKVLRPEYQEKLSQILQEKITIEQAQEVNSNLIKCRSSSL